MILQSHYRGRSHFQQRTSHKCFSQPLCFPIKGCSNVSGFSTELNLYAFSPAFRKHSLCWISLTVVGGNILYTCFYAKNPSSATALPLRHHTRFEHSQPGDGTPSHSDAEHITVDSAFTHSRKRLAGACSATSTLRGNGNTQLSKMKCLSLWSFPSDGRDGPLNSK